MESKGTVLHIEDDASLRRLINRVGERLGYRMKAVGTKAEANGIISTGEQIDVGIIDGKLQDTDGTEWPELAALMNEAGIRKITLLSSRANGIPPSLLKSRGVTRVVDKGDFEVDDFEELVNY